MKKFFNKKAVMLMAVVMVMAMSALPVFAAEGETTASNSDAVISAMSTGFTSVAADLGKVILAIVPIALGILGLSVLIKRGMAWFKSMSKG